MTSPYNWIASRGSREEQQDIEGMIFVCNHATRMMQEGKITPGQLHDIEAGLLTETMNRLPVEAYVEMRKNGQWEELERRAAHDGTRSFRDVSGQRNGLLRHVLRDAWSEGWTAGHVDDDTYNTESRKLGVPDDLKEAINDKDENASIDAYILNTFGEADYRQYREEVKRSEAPTVKESDEVSDEDIEEFRALGIIETPEPAEASSDQSGADAAPAEEPEAF